MAEWRKEIEAILTATQEQAARDTPADTQTGEQDGQKEKTVIDVDLYRLDNGAILLVPGGTNTPLDHSAVESTGIPQNPPSPEEEDKEPDTITTPTIPLTIQRH